MPVTLDRWNLRGEEEEDRPEEIKKSPKGRKDKIILSARLYHRMLWSSKIIKPIVARLNHLIDFGFESRKEKDKVNHLIQSID